MHLYDTPVSPPTALPNGEKCRFNPENVKRYQILSIVYDRYALILLYHDICWHLLVVEYLYYKSGEFSKSKNGRVFRSAAKGLEFPFV